MRLFTAFILSNLFDLFFSYLLPWMISWIAYFVYKFTVLAGLDSMQVTNALAFISAYRYDDTLAEKVLTVFIGGSVSFYAGYLAAKIARKRYLLMGLLSSVFTTLLIPILIRLPIFEDGIIYTATFPLLGLLGGYFYLRKVRKYAAIVG